MNRMLTKGFMILSLVLSKKGVTSVTCPGNGVYYSPLNYCYWFLSTDRSKSGQESECSNDNGNLANIPELGAQQFIETNLGSDMLAVNKYVFIGVTKGWYWIADGPIYQQWFNWEVGHPELFKTFIALDPHNGFKWKSVTSTNLFGSDPVYTALCNKEALTQSDCPSGGIHYSILNYCYWYENTLRERDDQKTECESHGGNLGVIPDQTAQNYIEAMFGSMMSNDGELVITGIFLSSEWPPGYSNWDTTNGQPDGGSVTVLDPANSFKWRDESTSCGWFCSVEYPALCSGEIEQTTTESITTTTVTTTTTETLVTTKNEESTFTISSQVSTIMDEPTTGVVFTTQNNVETYSTSSSSPSSSSSSSSSYVSLSETAELTTNAAFTTHINDDTSGTSSMSLSKTAEITSNAAFTTQNNGDISVTSSVSQGSTVDTSITQNDTEAFSSAINTVDLTTESPTNKISSENTLETTVHDTSSRTETSTSGGSMSSTLTSISNSHSDVCQCKCTDLPQSNSSSEILTLEEQIEEMVKKLKVDKKKTSASIRKLKSADDPRESAKQIGGIGVAILSLVFGGLILLDLQSFIWFFRQCVGK